jgi:hypothetical protein
VQIQLVRALLGRGMAPEALERARRLQAGNPGVPDAHVLVGDARGIQGDYKARSRNTARRRTSLSPSRWRCG